VVSIFVSAVVVESFVNLLFQLLNRDKQFCPLEKENFAVVNISMFWRTAYAIEWGSPTIFTLIGGACVPSVITFGTPRLVSIT
jgi:hypothetical protein